MHGVNTEAALQITTEDHVEKALPASDRCLSLLKTVNHVNGPVPAMPDRRYDASKAAGLVLFLVLSLLWDPKRLPIISGLTAVLLRPVFGVATR